MKILKPYILFLFASGCWASCKPGEAEKEPASEEPVVQTPVSVIKLPMVLSMIM